MKVIDLIEEVNSINIDKIINTIDNLDNINIDKINNLKDSIDIIDNTISEIEKINKTLNILSNIGINYQLEIDTNHYNYINCLKINFMYDRIKILIRKESIIYKNMNNNNIDDNKLIILVEVLKDIKKQNQKYLDIINSNIIIL